MKSEKYSVSIIQHIVMLIVLAGVVFLCTSHQKVDASRQDGEVKKSHELQYASKKFRILHIMSYHSPWQWTDDQLKGFRDALKDVDIEYRIFQMDTKRNSSSEWKEKTGKEARALIDSWKPDLVYTNDDNAQQYVAKYYVNKDIPFVFSGVNKAPEEYGYRGSKNMAGVIEQEHFVQTVQFLKKIIPGVSRIAVIVDDGPTWDGVIKRMKSKAPGQLRDIEFVSWTRIHTFQEYKQKIKEYENNVDAVALLGIFTYKDKNGKNVPYQEVLKWTAENSRIPDFSFWKDRIHFGTLCAVTVSGYNQGFSAGKIARGILIEGKAPSSYPFEPTVKGEPLINLARARKLKLKIDSDVLLSSSIVRKFEWEK